MMPENNRLDVAMVTLNALSQPGTDLERLFAAMQLNGLMMTGASAEIITAIEEFGLHYNSICETYPPAAFETQPPGFHSADTADLIGRLRPLCELIRDAETEHILSCLRKHDRKLPEPEIIQARRHHNWFVPLLLQECQKEIDKLKQKPDPHEKSSVLERTSVPFYAFFLFSEWETVESIPIILEGLSSPGEGPFDLFGDCIHEQLARYLAQFLSSDLDRIDALICDPKVNMYVRWAAASSYPFLVRDKKITSEEAITRLESNFHKTKVIGEDGRPGYDHCYELSAGIIDNLYKLGCLLKSFLGEGDQNWDFIEESIFHRDDSEVSLSESEQRNELLELPPTRISDCLEPLRQWACFEVRPKPFSAILEPLYPSRRPTPPVTSGAPSTTGQSSNATGTLRKVERVSRNAKCPCGSGKKFKQCCLRR